MQALSSYLLQFMRYLKLLLWRRETQNKMGSQRIMGFWGESKYCWMSRQICTLSWLETGRNHDENRHKILTNGRIHRKELLTQFPMAEYTNKLQSFLFFCKGFICYSRLITVIWNSYINLSLLLKAGFFSSSFSSNIEENFNLASGISS